MECIDSRAIRCWHLQLKFQKCSKQGMFDVQSLWPMFNQNVLKTGNYSMFNLFGGGKCPVLSTSWVWAYALRVLEPQGLSSAQMLESIVQKVTKTWENLNMFNPWLMFIKMCLKQGKCSISSICSILGLKQGIGSAWKVTPQDWTDWAYWAFPFLSTFYWTWPQGIEHIEHFPCLKHFLVLGSKNPMRKS